MPNENCLAGIKCPKCGNEDRFLITATILADVSDDGADLANGSDILWEDESGTGCPECGENGPLSHFRAEEQQP